VKGFRNRAAAFGGALGLALILVLATNAAPAFAQNQICGNGGLGYCLNDWNGMQGQNMAVKMYYGGSTNENFYVQVIHRCSSSGLVTATCPLNNHSVDAQLAGDFYTIQIVYNGAYCVGTDGAGKAVLTTCNSQTTGSGGGNGTVLVDYYGVDIDNYWSNLDGNNVSCMMSGGNPGVQAYFSGGVSFSSLPGNCTLWAG